jgi:HAD superfamily hydrolase (TIGR01509 family)
MGRLTEKQGADQCSRTRYFHNSILQDATDSARLVVLDMNGLIIDDESVQFESVNRALEDLHISISETYWIEKCVGKRADEYFHAILKENEKRCSPSEVSILVKLKNKLYHTLIVKHIHELSRPGVRDFIAYLSKESIKPLALCTSAHPEEIETILGKSGLGLTDRFSFVVSGRDVKKSKPDPEIYIHLAYLAKIMPSDCLVFEDSSLGVQAAFHAGMPCIAVPNRFTEQQDFSNAMFIIDSLMRDAHIYCT